MADVIEFEPHVTPETLDIPNLTLIPHMGTSTQETRLNMEKLLWANVEAFFQSGSPPNIVARN